MNNNFKLEAVGDFPFNFFIEKAVAIDFDKEMFIEGVASTGNVDHDGERMSKEALISMANIINKEGVPLRIEHQKNDNAIVGRVVEGKVDERNQLKIKAILDKNHPASSVLHNSLKQGIKLGLSVGGRIKRAIKEFVESKGAIVKTFYDVILDEVSVTSMPSNYDAWLVQKSLKSKGEDVAVFYKSPLYREFLFENPAYDYIQTFAKSIPNESWKKVEIINQLNKDMSDKEKTDEETKAKAIDINAHDQDAPGKDKTEEVGDEHIKAMGDEKTETETKSVSAKDFNAFKSMVVKGFNSLSSLLAKMDTAPKDTTNPDKDKTEVVGDKEVGKAREGQEDTGENGGETTKDMGDETDETKTKAVEDTETETKTKATETEDTKTETKNSYGQEYQLKSMNDAIGRINSLLRKYTKAEDTKIEDEKTEKSVKVASIDRFAVGVTQLVEKLTEKVEGKGYRIPGFEKHIVETIKNDKEIQASIAEMLKEPGFKKSVSVGVPYMVTKDGRRFSLVAQPLEDMKKSERANKNFKEVYKSEFSSIAEN